MAWNTGITYVATSPVNAALLNGIGNDLRVWGAAVDAGGYGLSNLASLRSKALTIDNTTDSAAVFALSGVQKWMLYYTAASSSMGMYDVVNGVFRTTLLPNGNFGVGTLAPTSKLHVVGLATYASNAAALAAALTAGAFYTDGAGAVKVVF